MEENFIIGFIILISLAVLFPITVIYMSKKRQDEYLVSFYKACDQLRDYIHTCSNRAEALELLDEIVSVKESFENLIPISVLDKELSLLSTLLDKKVKKIK